MKAVTEKFWFRLICFTQVLLILVSTIGLVLDIHYCQGEVKSVGFFASADKCCMETQKVKCDDEVATTISKKSCCKNLAIYAHSTDLANEQAVTIEKQQMVALKQLPQLVFTSPKGFTHHSETNKKPPPIPIGDINILYSTFLI